MVVLRRFVLLRFLFIEIAPVFFGAARRTVLFVATVLFLGFADVVRLFTLRLVVAFFFARFFFRGLMSNISLILTCDPICFDSDLTSRQN